MPLVFKLTINSPHRFLVNTCAPVNLYAHQPSIGMLFMFVFVFVFVFVFMFLLSLFLLLCSCSCSSFSSCASSSFASDGRATGPPAQPPCSAEGNATYMLQIRHRRVPERAVLDQHHRRRGPPVDRLPAPSRTNEKSVPRGALMQHLAPRRNPELSNGGHLIALA